ncbi:hypothetical protein BJ875DRAFT_381903 [Amylocarpus encephaloides]|uniref:Protein phosphatase 1 regulatory subunit 7 n=1 Tax=Amylocarpus encephaloides TaxID=45428 RepID=A0A9P8C4D6_9HELO|nr:hypothetical protein BJ875DRAFT_381903 [Amylocarpus encephaloides]
MAASENEITPPRISINPEDIKGHEGEQNGSGTPRSSTGWDGKLRLEKKTELLNPEALSDPEYSDAEQVLPGQVIPADDDLLDEANFPLDTDEIDLIHARIAEIPGERLKKYKQVERLSFRQNTIAEIQGLSCLASTLKELDLYDNLIQHIEGLEELTNLIKLDLAFNKIKCIKNVSHLVKLEEIFLLQNKIKKIEHLDGLTKLRNLELGMNRIREIENLDTLTGLAELWLGSNKIVEIKGLDNLQNLKILSIQSNRIQQISGLDALPNLEEIYIAHNALSSVSGLEKVRSLRVLDISNNQVTSIVGLKHLEELEEVWASYNQLADIAEIENELKDSKKLNTVYFEGNPLHLKTPTLYRNKVRLALPQVMQIDASKSTF